MSLGCFGRFAQNAYLVTIFSNEEAARPTRWLYESREPSAFGAGKKRRVCCADDVGWMQLTTDCGLL